MVKGLFLKSKFHVFYLFEFFSFPHFFDIFQAGLHQTGQAGFGPETVNENLHFFAFPLIVNPCFLINLFFLGNLVIVLFGVSLDFPDLMAMKAKNVSSYPVHKTPVMSDEHQFPWPAEQKLFQPANGSNIKIIVWLIQKQQVIVSQKKPGQI